MPVPPSARHIDLGPADGPAAPPDVDAGVRRLIQATFSRGSTPRVCKTPRTSTILAWIASAKLIRRGDTRTTLQSRHPDLFGAWRAARLLSNWRSFQQLLAALPAHLVQREP